MGVTALQAVNWMHHRAHRRPDGGDDGFTLLEVIVSFGIFTVISISSTLALINVIQLSHLNQNRVVALNLARQQIDDLRLLNSTGHQLVSSLAAPQAFTVDTAMTPSATSACAPGASRAVTVTVSWLSTQSRSVRLDTVLAC